MIEMKIESKVSSSSQNISPWDPPQKQDFEISSFDQFRYSIKSFLESWNCSDYLIQIITYLFKFLLHFFNINKMMTSNFHEVEILVFSGLS
jgi:hypothetical protein